MQPRRSTMRFADITLGTVVRIADHLSNSTSDAEFDVRMFSTLTDLRDEVAATVALLVVRSPDGASRRFIYRGHHDTEQTLQLLQRLEQTDTWARLIEQRPVAQVSAGSVSEPVLAEVLAGCGLDGLWLVPAARSLPSGNFVLLGFEECPAAPCVDDGGALGILCTLLMSRVISREWAPMISALVGGVASAELDVPASVALPTAFGRSGLSAREQEVAVLIGSGLRVRQVAASLDLAEHTVRNHLKKIFAKLQIGSQMELVAMVRGGTSATSSPGSSPLVSA